MFVALINIHCTMFCKLIDVSWHWNVDKKFFFSFWFNLKKNVLELCKGKKIDLTSFKDNLPEHSVDLHAACPRCLAAEASKPGVNDGELTLWFTVTFFRRSLVHFSSSTTESFFIIFTFVLFNIALQSH